jgi:hypothetical protein
VAFRDGIWDDILGRNVSFIQMYDLGIFKLNISSALQIYTAQANLMFEKSLF